MLYEIYALQIFMLIFALLYILLIGAFIVWLVIEEIVYAIRWLKEKKKCKD